LDGTTEPMHRPPPPVRAPSEPGRAAARRRL